MSNKPRLNLLSSRPALTAAVAAWTMAGGSGAIAGPEGGQIVGGVGAISNPDSVTTRIDQASSRLAIDWQSFNVAANERVQFVQPGSTSLALNRILDQNPSQIFGAIDANGRVLLVNPNGMIFGRNASLNVAGIVATSLDVNPGQFMNGGPVRLAAAEGLDGGAIENQGVITAAPGGFVVLAGGAVRNSGVIVADLGSIDLAAGRAATLDFSGNGLVLFEVDQGLAAGLAGYDSAVANSGELHAAGGRILLTAAAARDVYTSVVNNSGLIRANRIENEGGVVRLVATGGDTVHTGVIDASAGDAASTGGSVHLLGDRVGLFDAALVDASGAAGGGQVLVGGGFQGNDPTVANAEQTVVGVNARILADAGQSGNGGEVIIWADGSTVFAGSISARGGTASGNGGFAEVSGLQWLGFVGDVDLNAPNGLRGALLIDPTDLTIVETGDPNINVAALADANLFTANPGGEPAFLDVALINGSGADVFLKAENSLTFSAAISNAAISLDAQTTTGDIVIDQSINVGGAFTASAGGSMTVNAAVTAGTSIGLTVGNNLSVASSLTAPGITLTGGGAGQLSGPAAGANWSVTGPGAGTLDSADFSGFASIAGTGGADTLTGPDAATTWATTADNAGTVTATGGAQLIAFTGIETLQGGTAVDLFNLGHNVAANGGDGNDVFTLTGGTGALAGQGGSDTVNAAGALTVTAAGTGVAGGRDYSTMETLNGTGGADTLTGPDAATTWATTADNAGTVTATGGAQLIAFTGIETLQGGSGADAFILNDGVATFNGEIAGGGGENSLAASDGNNTWEISAPNGGTLNASTAFSQIQTLTGGSGTDTFDITAASIDSLSLSGGGGDDNRLSITDNGALNVTGNFLADSFQLIELGVPIVASGNIYLQNARDIDISLLPDPSTAPLQSTSGLVVLTGDPGTEVAVLGAVSPLRVVSSAATQVVLPDGTIVLAFVPEDTFVVNAVQFLTEPFNPCVVTNGGFCTTSFFEGASEAAGLGAAASQRAAGDRPDALPDPAAYTLKPYDVACGGVGLPKDQQDEAYEACTDAGSSQGAVMPDAPAPLEADLRAMAVSRDW